MVHGVKKRTRGHYLKQPQSLSKSEGSVLRSCSSAKHGSEQKAFLTLSTQTQLFPNTDTTPLSFHARLPFAVPHRPGLPGEVTREKDDRRPEAASAAAHLYCEANKQPIVHPGELGDPVGNRLRPEQARKRWLTQVQVPGSQGSSD